MSTTYFNKVLIINEIALGQSMFPIPDRAKFVT